MKTNNLYITLFAALAITACSKDNELPQGSAKDPNADMPDAYTSIAINIPHTTMTKVASGRAIDQGIADENKVKTLHVFIYDTDAPNTPTVAESTGQTGTSLSPTITPVPDKNTLSPTEVQASMTNKDLERTIYMAETYIGRPFSTTELNSFCYINDQLHFSSDLLEYLIEYCVTRGKKSVRYIESVAINWYQQGITSVQEAKEQSTLYSQNVFPIMKAFGISNRDPGSAELDYIKKWNSLGLGTDIIIEACSRTLLATHQASFPYANKILEDWKRLGVRNTSDIKHLDDKHRSTASSSSGSAAGYTQVQPRKGSTGAAARKNTAANQFHNFEQRTYDFNDLESRLLDKTRR